MLDWLRSLLKEPPPPIAVVDDPVLGRLTWDDDAEGWSGTLDGQAFILAYQQAPEPTEELRKYASATLRERTMLDDGLRKEKEVLLAALRESEGVRETVDEVRGLSYGSITFLARGNVLGVFAELEGGRDHRCWRIEFAEDECVGMGCDT